MRFNKKKWVMLPFKVGTGPMMSYFVRAEDAKSLLIPGQFLSIRKNDGITKPDFQHDESVMITESRLLGHRQLLYLADRF